MHPDNQLKPQIRPEPRNSTWAFVREAWKTRNYTFWDFLHGYVYIRWPYLYIGIGVGEHPIARLYLRWLSFVQGLFPGRPQIQSENGGMADTYHGKVVTTESARMLLNVREPIEFHNLEKIIPYPVAKDIIMSDPDHIVALECPCRAVRYDPCTPLDVCLIVGEPFASFVIEHHRERARWIDPEEGMDILEAEAERGHVHHAFFKDAMLGRFYAICNCCSCCCGAMQAVHNGVPMLTASGYLCVVELDTCQSCGHCEDICPFEAISFTNGSPVIQFEGCMGCGVCVRHCPEGALRLEVEPGKGLPLEMDELLHAGGYLSCPE